MSDFVAQSTFLEITVLMLVAAVFGGIGMVLRQPLIVSFIAMGLVVGPSALDIVHSEAKVHLLSELGIALLLFLVGIKLDVKLIRNIGGVSLMTGLGQVIFTSAIGYLIALGLGFDQLTSVYIAVALTFSSTIIIVKLLSDKKEIDSLHGQIAMGFLIVQDLVVVIAMAILATIDMGAAAQGKSSGSLGSLALSSGVFILFIIVFIRWLAEPLVIRLSKNDELLMVFSLALATVFASIAKLIGLGIELGGLLAGVALASTSIRDNIANMLSPLRDFLLLFFFVSLGLSIDLSTLGADVFSASVLSLFVLLGNPLIVLIIMGLLGYKKRTGFLAGLTVAQISEFSLIFVSMGIAIGHLAPSVLGVVTLVGLITIALSTYMISYSHILFSWLEPVLGVFERKGTPAELADMENAASDYDVIVIGLGRFGNEVVNKLQAANMRVLAVDFNAEVLGKAQERGIHTLYGDVSDVVFLAQVPFQRAGWIISTIPSPHISSMAPDTQTSLIEYCAQHNVQDKLSVVSHSDPDTQQLIQHGAKDVIQLYQDAAENTVRHLVTSVGQSASQI